MIHKELNQVPFFTWMIEFLIMKQQLLQNCAK